MMDPVFAADPVRLVLAASCGVMVLLLLIIKFKIHPVLSLLISALFIGLGAGMPVPVLIGTVEKGAGETLQGIVLLIGLGSLFGGILEGPSVLPRLWSTDLARKKQALRWGLRALWLVQLYFLKRE